MKTSRSKAMKQVKKHTRRFSLETLENRTLLSANPIDAAIDWHELEHQVSDNYAKDGYAHADPVFSDPSTWDAAFLENIPYVDSSESDDHSQEIVLDDIFTESMNATSTEYTLYLNFDAARVYSQAGDFWLGSTYVDVPGYDLSMYGWDGYESQSMEYIRQFVAEDYAAYNVTVTNTEPTSGEYTTMYIGGTSDWFQANSNIIGVASYDVGNRDASNYGFAFTEELTTYYSYSNHSLLNFSEYVANLVSHEAAHTFGANHIDDSSYIMNPYLPTSPRTSSFGTGTITNSSSTQDTQNLLGKNMGYLGSLDDYGDTVASAENISLDTTSISGLIEHLTDTDAFTFTADATGTFTVELSTTVYGNLDSTLSIYDADNNLVASNDDYYGQDDSQVSFNVASGQEYTIVVGSSNSESSGTYSLNLISPEGTPEIEVSDNEGSSSDLTINFGGIYVGQNQTYTITISNSGLKNLNISQITTSGNFDVAFPNSKSADLDIDSGEYTTIEVTFQPDAVTTENGQIIIQSNDADNSVVVIDIIGNGLAYEPDIEIANSSNDTIDFGTLLANEIGTGTITINNTGINTLEISSIVAPTGFTINSNTLSIAPGESQVVNVTFTADQTTTLSGNLIINSNDPDEPELTVTLTAEVYSQQDYLDNTSLTFTEADGLNDSNINAGNIEAGIETELNLWTINNNGFTDVTLTISNELANVFDLPSEVFIAAGQTYTLSTTFYSESPYAYSDEITVSMGGQQLETLTVDVTTYAVFGGRDKFEFIDNDGDSVQITLKNAMGKITLGSQGNADIENIELYDDLGGSKLTIKTSKDGTTTLGSLSGSGDIKMISAKTTDISGDLDFDGSIGKLQVNDILDDASLNFEADYYKGTTLQVNSTEGSINIDGMLKGIKANGNIGGDITVDGEINSISTKYDITANINANGYINKINALNIENAGIETSDMINSINVKGDMIDTDISSGYSTEFGYGSDFALINKVNVKGLFKSSNISSGVNSESRGSSNSNEGFVTINNIKLGSVFTENNGETFGILAGGYVNKVKIGKETINDDYQENDFVILNAQ